VPGALRLKNLFWQGVVLLAVILLLYAAATNAYENMQRQHIAAGWGFLGNTAGFALSQTLIAYSEVSTYGRAFVAGLLNTLLVAALGIIFATVLGFVIGIARLSHNWLVNRLALCYVELTRNVPLVLQLMFWYRAVFVPLPGPRDSLSLWNMFFLNGRGLFVPTPIVHESFSFVVWALVAAGALSFILWRFARNLQAKTGRILPVWQISLLLIIALPLITYYLLGEPLEWNYPELAGFNFTGGTRIIPEFVALLLGLTLYTAAFIAEIVRSGIQAVQRGQAEAALALGLSRNKTTRLIVLPQALRLIIPPLTSQYLNLTKNSSLAVAIGYPDLFTVAGTINNQTGQAIEVIVLTMGVYLTLSLLTSAVMNAFNARFALVER
jgi:general L-amino acid transport system permease protein